MRLIINSSKLPSLQVNLPNTIEILSIQLISATIPYTFTNVNTLTGTTILINNTPFSISIGQYNIYTLRDIINLAIFSTGVTLSVDRTTLLYTFTSNAVFTFNPCNLGGLMGFTNNVLITARASIVNTLTVYKIISTFCLDMTNGLRNIWIKSNLTDDNVYENSTAPVNLLARIPIAGFNYGDVIYYHSTSINTQVDFKGIKLNSIHFSLTDSLSNDINFNGVGFELDFFIEVADPATLKSINKLPADATVFHPYDLIKG